MQHPEPIERLATRRSRRLRPRATACRIAAALALAAGLAACVRATPLAESQFAAAIVGDWQGSVGEMKEAISFSADGGFVASLRPAGFISNTLSQGVTGTIRGSWSIAGKTITLTIRSAEDERVQNGATTSTILAFSQDELTLRSDRGETSTFLRSL